MSNPIFKNLFIIFFVFSVLILKGQNIDSLKNLLLKNQNNTEEINLLLNLISKYLIEDLDSTLHYSDILIEKAKKEKNPFAEAKAFYLKARAYNKKGKYQKGISALDKSRKLYKSLNNTKGIAQCLNVYGNIYQNLNKYDLANLYYDSSLVNAIEINDSSLIMNNLGGLAISFDYRGKYDKAIEYYFKVIKYFENKKDLLKLSKAYANVGVVYYLTKQMQKAIEYYNKSIKIKRKLKNYEGLTLTFNNLSSVYIDLNDLDKAQSLIDSAIVYAKKIKSDKQNSILYSKKGTIFENKKMYNKALFYYKKSMNTAKQIGEKYNIAVAKTNIGELLCKMGNLKDGKKYLNEALIYSQRIGEVNFEKYILNNLIGIYKQSPEYGDIIKKYERVIELRDTMYSKQKLNTIAEIETKYQTQKKETENKLLKKDKELLLATTQKQKITIWSTIIGLVLFGFLSFLLYRQNKIKQKSNKLLQEKNEKIELLHKELSHRVKNNLAFISGLMRMQGRRLDNEEAIKAVKEGESRIEAMSLLHRKLYLQENTQVNIGEYIEELCGNLQNTYPFSGKKPKIELNIENVTVDGETAMRIGLIVNELVTNSFKYAFEGADNPVIEIILNKKDESNYTLKYYDNGKGFPAEFDISKTKSLGLKLIYTLTKQLNGNLEIENKKGTSFIFNFEEKKIA